MDDSAAEQLRRTAVDPGGGSTPADATASSTGEPAGHTAPFTERILSRLPGSRLGWIIAWSLVPWVNVAIVLTSGGLEWVTTADLSSELLNRTAVSVAVLLSLWGAARIDRDLSRLRVTLTHAVEQERPDVDRIFRGIDSSAGPLILTAAIAVVLPLDEALHGDTGAAILQAATWLIFGIPLSTAVWVYLALQLGLDRLGRGRLTLRTYSGDRTLGLEPVGALAFTGFWMLFGAVTPIVLTSSADLPTVIVGSLVLLVALCLFFLSVRGLHRQMTAIKHREMHRAANLYAQAYEKVQENPTLDVLEQQTPLLNAAENLEKRAERIQVWPFDEPTFARAATIATSAVATIVARMLLAPTGL
ncbi:hypothetical protein ACFFGH_20990 [Lysobacter korlensis]|uniref:Uncharacterized protein n=1 Tax=Lysobacter korlensis TaxID=553636 RepID=A0ABV6RUN7_9GAMM